MGGTVASSCPDASAAAQPGRAPAPARLYFERDAAGWNNVRITFESLVCVARVLGRELVLPPPTQIDHLSTPFHETLIYDVPSLRRAAPVALAGEPPEGPVYRASLAELLDASAGGTALPLDLRLCPELTRLTHFELLFRGRPQERLAAETVLALEIAAPYRDAALAALARAGLEPGKYHAVHLRRGDFARTRPDTQWTGKTAAAHVRSAFPPEEAHWPLLVACVVGSGEDNDPFAELSAELGAERRVVRTDALASATDGPLLAVLLDTLLLVHAGRFCGTPYSTFSTGVEHWRAAAAARAGKASPDPCALGRGYDPEAQESDWQRSTTFAALQS